MTSERLALAQQIADKAKTVRQLNKARLAIWELNWDDDQDGLSDTKAYRKLYRQLGKRLEDAYMAEHPPTSHQLAMLQQIAEHGSYTAHTTKEQNIGFALSRKGLAEGEMCTKYSMSDLTGTVYEYNWFVFTITPKGKRYLTSLSKHDKLK